MGLIFNIFYVNQFTLEEEVLMKNVLLIHKVFIVVLIAVLAIVMGQPSAFAKITLRYAHPGVAGESQTRFADEFKVLVEKRTEGRVEIQVFPAHQLGSTSEMVDGVKIGTIDICHHDFAILGKLYGDMSVFNAPYIFRDAEHAMRATSPNTSPLLRELNTNLVNKVGIRVIGSFYRGARQLTCNFPVYSPADLKGKKIRGVPFPIWMSMLRGMNAIPTPVEFPELATALMTGVVVGQENPLNNIYSAKLYEVQKYAMMTSHMQSVLCLFTNEKSWNRIPQKDRDIILGVIEEVGSQTVAWDRDAVADLTKKLEAGGMTFITEKNGLKLEEFKSSVSKRIKADFPEWAGYIDQIQAIK